MYLIQFAQLPGGARFAFCALCCLTEADSESWAEMGVAGSVHSHGEWVLEDRAEAASPCPCVPAPGTKAGNMVRDFFYACWKHGTNSCLKIPSFQWRARAATFSMAGVILQHGKPFWKVGISFWPCEVGRERDDQALPHLSCDVVADSSAKKSRCWLHQLLLGSGLWIILFYQIFLCIHRNTSVNIYLHSGRCLNNLWADGRVWWYFYMRHLQKF